MDENFRRTWNALVDAKEDPVSGFWAESGLESLPESPEDAAEKMFDRSGIVGEGEGGGEATLGKVAYLKAQAAFLAAVHRDSLARHATRPGAYESQGRLVERIDKGRRSLGKELEEISR